jgi:hypothetical protein
MTQIKIYGASDDLIEIEGDIREEFEYWSNYKNYFAFSDGTLLQIEYCDDGIWRIKRIVAGSLDFTNEEAADADAYSDVVTLSGNVKKLWIVYGNQVAK